MSTARDFVVRSLKGFAKSLPGLRRIVAERDALRSQVAEFQRLEAEREAVRSHVAPFQPFAAESDDLHAHVAQFQRFEAERKRLLQQTDLPEFENSGYCPCCSSIVKFVASGPWWRDQYLCSQCGSIPRERALMYCVDSFFPTWRNATIHESSPSNRGASLRLSRECPGYLPTQYFPGIPSGSVHNGVQCENLEVLSFKDNSMDLHVTQDVLEHILRPDRAFKEIARTLKPGGAHIFTVPLVNKHKPTQMCARQKEDGSIEYLMKPEYHGNPISEDGSLVTFRWGYDICDYIFRHCGLSTKIIILDSLDLGIRAELIEVLITEKPVDAAGPG